MNTRSLYSRNSDASSNVSRVDNKPVNSEHFDVHDSSPLRLSTELVSVVSVKEQVNGITLLPTLVGVRPKSGRETPGQGSRAASPSPFGTRALSPSPLESLTRPGGSYSVTAAAYTWH